MTTDFLARFWRNLSPLRRELLLLAAILVAVGIPKIALGLHTTDFGADGGFYTNVAGHIRDGDGLVTDISVFHHGFRAFPHPTSVYPMWPFFYAMWLKVLPVEIAGVWVPTALYFVALVLGFFWARKAFPGELMAAIVPSLNAGHVLVIMLGANSEFADATSQPYTEGIGYTLLFACFWRAQTLLVRRGLRDAVEMGAWLGILFLTRSQLLVVVGAGALTAALMVITLPERARNLRFALVSGSVFCLLMAPMMWWMSTFVDNAGLGTYLRFDMARTASTLSLIPITAKTTGLLDLLVDRFDGVVAAYGWNSASSFYGQFFAFAFAIPVFVAAIVWRARRLRTSSGAAARSWLSSPDNMPLVFVSLAAAAALASLHAMHKVYGAAWPFGMRHGIIGALSLFLTWLWLMRAGGVLRNLAMCMLIISAFLGVRSVSALAGRAELGEQAGASLFTYRLPLVRWLEGKKQAEGTLTVALTRPEPQRLAWRVPGVGFHWITETTTTDDLLTMVKEMGVRYVVTVPGRRESAFEADARFRELFVTVDRFRAPARPSDRPLDDSAENEDPERMYGDTVIIYAPRPTP